MKRKRSRRANIAIDTIFVLFVSIIGIFFLLFLFSGKIPALGKDVYCKSFFHLQSSRYFPEPIRQSQDYCIDSSRRTLLVSTIAPKQFMRLTLADGSTTQQIPSSGTLQFTFPEDAQVFFANLTFYSTQPLGPITIDVAGDGVIEQTIATFNVTRKFASANNPAIAYAIYRAINNTQKPCPNRQCAVSVLVSSTATFIASDVDVRYQSCAVLDTILAQMILCDDSINNADIQKNVQCGEVPMPAACGTISYTEAEAVAELSRQGLCSRLPKESLGCGVGDKVSWQKTTFRPGDNVLIEYQYRTKQIVVS